MPVFRGPVTRSSTAHTPTRKCQIAKLSARCSNSIWSVLTVCSYCLMRCPSDEFIKCAIIEPLMLKLATWMGVRFDSQIDWLPEWFALWFLFYFCADWLTAWHWWAKSSCGVWLRFWPSEIDTMGRNESRQARTKPTTLMATTSCFVQLLF